MGSLGVYCCLGRLGVYCCMGRLGVYCCVGRLGQGLIEGHVTSVNGKIQNNVINTIASIVTI